jgi:hypothetical protein
MWLVERTLGAVRAYLEGFNQARSGAPLFGFHQWLVVRNNGQNNVAWEVTARKNLPAVDESEEFDKRHPDIAALGKLLAEFFADRRKLGLSKILRAHEEWMDTPSIDRAIADIARRYNKPLGKTALPGHRNYEAAKNVCFKLCECFAKSFEGYVEYIGRGSSGGIHSVGCDDLVTVGPKSMHFRHDTNPCC